MNSNEMTDLSPKNLGEAMQFADILAKSSIVPKDFQKNPGNILVAIQWGMELGLKPMQAMQNIAVINGRPSLWGDSVIAIAQAHPQCEYINESFDDKTMTAYCEVKRTNEPSPHVAKFSLDDAKTAGLANKQGPWKQYPKRMLQMRARAFALRDKFSDALKGMPIAEEVRDYTEKEVNPSPNGASGTLRDRLSLGEVSATAAKTNVGPKTDDVVSEAPDVRKPITELSDAALAWKNSIDTAESQAVLKRIGFEFAADKEISNEEKALLRPIYREKMDALAAPEAVEEKVQEFFGEQ